ncbi:MAG: nitroreductase family protein [Acidaminococcaceae bacterium]
MELIQVNQEKCVKCGLCAEVCPSCIITMGVAGPECLWDRGCMACGHCVAICPTAAMENIRCPLEEQTPLAQPVLDKTVAYNFLRARRSVRNFKSEPVAEEQVRELLDIARYAPTAGNSQGLYYIVLSDRAIIRQVADLTATWMEEEIAANSPHSRYFGNVLKTYRQRGQDIIARNAPQLIFAVARKLNQTGISNCEQAWAYAELFAPTIGLGTTIAGFIQTCGQAGYAPLLELLKIPKKQRLVGAMMVGYPKYSFKRLVERQHLKVEFR